VKKSLLLLPLVLIASAFALAACGGGGSSSGGGDEAETAVAEVIEKSAMSTSPSKCTEFQTEAFNEQDQAVEGSEALKACEENVEEDEIPAEKVDVSNISVEGESATAEAAITGSALNGQTVELEVVEEEGTWKLNKFLSFTKFDGAALTEGLEEEFEREGEVEPELAECVSEVIGNAQQAQVEEFAFEGKVEVVEEIAKGCE
jgi:hypothetical protein